MEIEALKEHYFYLQALLTEFQKNDYESIKSAKKADRSRALYNLEVNLMQFESYWSKNPELSDYFFSVSGSGNQDFYLSELNSIKYFGRDMSRILKRMEAEISEKPDKV
jgi:hypothetical protein